MDIVEWLRAPHLATKETHEAADEIERLRQQNAKLMEALQKISAVDDERLPTPSTPEEGVLWVTLDACVGLARKATGR